MIYINGKYGPLSRKEAADNVVRNMESAIFHLKKSADTNYAQRAFHDARYILNRDLAQEGYQSLATSIATGERLIEEMQQYNGSDPSFSITRMLLLEELVRASRQVAIPKTGSKFESTMNLALNYMMSYETSANAMNIKGKS